MNKRLHQRAFSQGWKLMLQGIKVMLETKLTEREALKLSDMMCKVQKQTIRHTWRKAT